MPTFGAGQSMQGTIERLRQVPCRGKAHPQGRACYQCNGTGWVMIPTEIWQEWIDHRRRNGTFP